MNSFVCVDRPVQSTRNPSTQCSWGFVFFVVSLHVQITFEIRGDDRRRLLLSSSKKRHRNVINGQVWYVHKQIPHSRITVAFCCLCLGDGVVVVIATVGWNTLAYAHYCWLWHTQQTQHIGTGNAVWRIGLFKWDAGFYHRLCFCWSMTTNGVFAITSFFHQLKLLFNVVRFFLWLFGFP